MPRFLSTRGNAVLSIAICDRCRLKRAYVDLGPDPNQPGLRVCRRCADEVDPYRLPGPPPDIISLEYPRPDVRLEPTSLLVDEFGNVIAWSDGPAGTEPESGGIDVADEERGHG
jgi:hypothetical protein